LVEELENDTAARLYHRIDEQNVHDRWRLGLHIYLAVDGDFKEAAGVDRASCGALSLG
jgi:hypothetical protein